MAMMKNYELTSGGGPIFNKPACSVSYPYSSNTKNAADISSVWDYIDGILSSISSLSNDFESIKNKIILFKGQAVLLYFSMKLIINIIRSITKVV